MGLLVKEWEIDRAVDAELNVRQATINGATDLVRTFPATLTGEQYDLPPYPNFNRAQLAAIFKSLTPEPWQLLTYAANWGNNGGGYQVGRYRFVSPVEVRLDGEVLSAVGAGTVIATLPAGYRPTARIQLGVWGNGAAVIAVQTNGDIELLSANAPPVAFNLTGFAFFID